MRKISVRQYLLLISNILALRSKWKISEIIIVRIELRNTWNIYFIRQLRILNMINDAWNWKHTICQVIYLVDLQTKFICSHSYISITVSTNFNMYLYLFTNVERQPISVAIMYEITHFAKAIILDKKFASDSSLLAIFGSWFVTFQQRFLPFAAAMKQNQ